MTLTLLAVMSGNASNGMVLSAQSPTPSSVAARAEDEDPLADREGDDLVEIVRVIPPRPARPASAARR